MPNLPINCHLATRHKPGLSNKSPDLNPQRLRWCLQLAAAQYHNQYAWEICCEVSKSYVQLFVYDIYSGGISERKWNSELSQAVANGVPTIEHEWMPPLECEYQMQMDEFQHSFECILVAKNPFLFKMNIHFLIVSSLLKFFPKHYFY